jgi:glycosyl transferase family 25
MATINDFFDKVFVISLKGSERRSYFTDTFSKLGIEFEFYDAVRGSELSPETIDNIYDEEAALSHKTTSRSLTVSELGCALSHLNIYKLMKKENYQQVLIFEDDAKPVNENIDEIEHAINDLPKDWELLYLGVKGKVKAPLTFRLKLFLYYPFVKLLIPKLIKWDYKELWRLYPSKYSEYLKNAGYHQGSHAYGITLEGGQKLLEKNKKIAATYDALLGQAIVENVINGFLVKENIFIQNPEFESQIEGSRRETEKNIFKKFKND